MTDAPPRPALKLAAFVAQSLGGRLDGVALLARVRAIAAEMMRDRGLRVLEEEEDDDEGDDLLRRIDAREPLLRAVDAVDETTTLVVLDADERTGVKLLRTLREAHGAAARLCLVSALGPTPYTKKEVAADAAADVEFWQVRELLANPTRHALVPPHTALTPAQAAALQDERCVRPRQFPTLPTADMICRWYRFPKGTVVRIDRSGLAHEPSVYYRRVA